MADLKETVDAQSGTTNDEPRVLSVDLTHLSPRNLMVWEWAWRFCRPIIEAHNGRIWMAANKPQSTVFHLVLLAEFSLDSEGVP